MNRSPSELHTNDDQDCAHCGYKPNPLPSWAVHGAAFALDGRAYRIVAVGSGNGLAPGNGYHCWPHVTAQEVKDEKWELPPSGTPLTDLASAMADLRRLPRFTGRELARAIFVAAKPL